MSKRLPDTVICTSIERFLDFLYPSYQELWPSFRLSGIADQLRPMVAMSGAVVVASALAALLGWAVWYRARQALRYDLHKIPGPAEIPLLGNMASVVGSSYVHKVRRLIRWQNRVALYMCSRTFFESSEISDMHSLLTEGDKLQSNYLRRCLLSGLTSMVLSSSGVWLARSCWSSPTLMRRTSCAAAEMRNLRNLGLCTKH